MQELSIVAAVSGAVLTGLGVIAAAALKGWHGWLDLKRAELGSARPGTTTVAERIEVADLRERVRRLEAIAACVDL